MWKDAKYLLAFAMPLIALLGLFLGNYWTYLGFGFAFVFMPLVESFSKGSDENIEEGEENGKTKEIFFDILLYLNLPLLYYIVFVYFQAIPSYNLIELLGATLSAGLMLGAIGINVAHELGHRATIFDQRVAKLLLLPSLYMHFFIEHNKGHHKNVATDLDPASAKLGEPIYAFWFRSVWGCYMSAWRIEAERLAKQKISFWSIENEMLQFHFVQLSYIVGVAYFFGINYIFALFAIAIVGVLLLESVNYIEHYGLRRKQLSNGHYEQVLPSHSWSCNHELGRIVLYELTRHADHHYKSTRKYQILKHHEESPQLPYGYPSCILISLIPPIWFSMMKKKLAEIQP
jgi:alkane 1-monooxygenase